VIVTGSEGSSVTGSTAEIDPVDCMDKSFCRCEFASNWSVAVCTVAPSVLVCSELGEAVEPMKIATARSSPAPAGNATPLSDDRLVGFIGDELRGCITDKAWS
jgi:hypothetical protein